MSDETCEHGRSRKRCSAIHPAPIPHDGHTVNVGYVHTPTEPGGPCREGCPHPDHAAQPAPVAPDEASIEALAELIHLWLDGAQSCPWSPKSMCHNTSRTRMLIDEIRALGYLSPAEVEARVRAGKAEAWDEGHDEFCEYDGATCDQYHINPYHDGADS